MKQHITIEQLSELTPKGKEKLREWFLDSIEYDDDQVLMYLPDQDNRVCGGNWDQEIKVFDMDTLEVTIIQKLKNYEGRMHPLLSIGQMIEFLDDQKDLEEEPGFKLIGWHKSKELCDTLWEAVKEVLES